MNQKAAIKTSMWDKAPMGATHYRLSNSLFYRWEQHPSGQFRARKVSFWVPNQGWKETTTIPPSHLNDPALFVPRPVKLVADEPIRLRELNGGELSGRYTLEAPGYEELARGFFEAFQRSSKGKGLERHGRDNGGKQLPFTQQAIMQENRELGSIDGCLYQIKKKAGELKRFPTLEAKKKELYDIAVYAIAAALLEEEFARNAE